MPTLLTNPRMSPSLQRRLEAGLARRPKKGAPRRPFVSEDGSSRTRWIVVGSLLVVIGLMVTVKVYEDRDIERRRAALLASISGDRDALTPQQVGFLPRVERWVTDTAARDYPGDFLPALMESGELDGWLARPIIYVRGAAAELSEAGALRKAASTSVKDSFLLCLLVPPYGRAEATVLSTVRGVNYGGAMVESLTFNVRRLHDAAEGLYVLGSGFHERVVAADKPTVIKQLEKELAEAPVAAGMWAATAELALIVVDEQPAGMPAPKPAPGREESPLLARIEERPHEARVAVVDLVDDKLLVRIRRRLDASERFPKARALHVAAVQGCGLALDVRDAAEGDPSM